MLSAMSSQRNPGKVSKLRHVFNHPTDSVEVYARIRKVEKSSKNSCIKVLNDSKLLLQSPCDKVTECEFTRVFNCDVEQQDIFAAVAKPLVEDLIEGKNGLVFTYGVTNSGKTYTMTGTVEDPGLLPCSLDMIFNSISGLQTSKYRFIPDDFNGFEIQTEADALLDKQQKEILPNLQAPKVATQKQLRKTPYNVQHCFSENVDPDCRYSVFVSYTEIYNETVIDLLGEDLLDSFSRSKPKRLREDKEKKSMYVSGVTQVEVQTTEQAFAAFHQGQEKRRIAHTQLNAVSSRSHSIFNIKLVQAPMDPLGEDLLSEKKLICISQLSLVDLAGSERLARTGSRNERLREAGNINNSLMSLRRCLEQLRQNQKNKAQEMVKYRNSKLTYLFKSYFEGHGKVRMVLCLNPSVEEYEENIHVVQFAETAQKVEIGRSKAADYDSVKKRFLEKHKLLSSQSSGVSESSAASTPVIRWKGIDCDLASFPDFFLCDCTDSETLPALIQFLESRVAMTNHIKKEALSLGQLFRKNVANGSLSNRDLQSRMIEVESELSENTKDVAKLERQVKKLESKNQILSKTTKMFEKDKKELQDLLSGAEIQLKNAQSEKRHLETKLEQAVSSARSEVEKFYQNRVRSVRSELVEQIHAKNERLRQLKAILSPNKDCLNRYKSNILLFSSAESTSSSMSVSFKPKNSNRRRSKSSENHLEKKRNKISNTKSSSYIMSVSPNSGQKENIGVQAGAGEGHTVPKSVHCCETVSKEVNTERQIDTSNAQGDNSTLLREHENSRTLGCSFVNRHNELAFRHRPAPPVVNRHRRGPECSDGRSWLAHCPYTTLTSQTIMQPSIKPSRIVNVPSPKDVAHASKYVLTHQCEDTDGEIETQLVKGEVFKTRTGGQSVQFVDVETLKQSDPQKHSTSDSSKRTRSCKSDFEDSTDEQSSWTDVETRCACGVGSANAEPMSH